MIPQLGPKSVECVAAAGRANSAHERDDLLSGLHRGIHLPEGKMGLGAPGEVDHGSAGFPVGVVGVGVGEGGIEVAEGPAGVAEGECGGAGGLEYLALYVGASICLTDHAVT